MVEIKFEGFSEFEAKLERLRALGATQKDFERMYRSSARPIANDMKKLSGRNRTGALKKSIGIRKAKKARNVGAKFVIGPRGGKKGAPHAHLVNLGTRGGVYTAKRFSRFSIRGSGGEVLRPKSITKRAKPGRFFVKRGFDAKVGNVEKSMFRKFDKFIKKHLEP